jgi:ribose 5-phosphate isomerase B
MRIAIGADHGGFLLKQRLIKFLGSNGHVVVDMGTHDANPCDYPVYAAKVAKAVASRQFKRGILICKSGIGMSIAANKIPGIRAALCWDKKGAESSRLHNDANIICLAAKKITFDLAKKMVEIWLETKFEGARHARRVKQMERLSK